MALLSCRWEADWNGHHFTVHRNEVTKGFSVEFDGRVLDERRWSLIGTGTLTGTVEVDGREVPVKVTLPLSLRGRCDLEVDGVEVPVRQVE
jgi:hypothetical protein